MTLWEDSRPRIRLGESIMTRTNGILAHRVKCWIDCCANRGNT